jgi:hypothetical protein
LAGSLQNLSVSLLASYFDDGCREGAMAVLGGLTLKSLDMLYTYSKESASAQKSTASSFLISGILVLGELELDLSYQYVSALVPIGEKPAAAHKWAKNANVEPPAYVTLLQPKSQNEFSFEAYLNTTSPDSTIGSVADSIASGSSAILPHFISGIPIKRPATSTGAENGPQTPPIALKYSGGTNEESILTVYVSIDMFNLTFVQIRSQATQTVPATVKRILRFSVDQIPMMEDIPLVSKMPQPFDHLIYMYVADEDMTSPNPGITRDLLAKINTKIPAIQIKDTKKRTDPTDLVLAKGHHFMVVANGTVVLDHVFQNAATKPAPPGPAPPQKAAVKVVDSGVHTHAATLVPGPAEQTLADPPSTGDTNTKAGPLSVTGLSVQYKEGSLFVGLDATLDLGPISFSVIGFTLEIDMNNIHLDHLADIVTKNLVHASLHGLDVGISKGPLTLKGVFVHDSSTPALQPDGSNITKESYRGGIAVGFKAWQILAVGEYQIVSRVDKDKNKSQYRSVFV